MRAGTKRTLAECLETDDSYSEMVHDDMWTRNSAGLHIARNSGILDMLETKGVQATVRSQQQKVSDLHDMINRVGQQKIMESAVGCSHLGTDLFPHSGGTYFVTRPAKTGRLSVKESWSLTKETFGLMLSYTIVRASLRRMGSDFLPVTIITKQLYGVAPALAVIIGTL
ncbi:unnamed protein product [Aspergillus oryzae var. brunneus]|uniref:Unnamed protein product n=1 Tax=Aspergillus oryzae var. brunneus TaxID=332754 RepID=A0ABQ6KMT0_ASPOZ|nr:unnamed protein product [Aspergillus oryzae var. brunneus]